MMMMMMMMMMIDENNFMRFATRTYRGSRGRGIRKGTVVYPHSSRRGRCSMMELVEPLVHLFGSHDPKLEIDRFFWIHFYLSVWAYLWVKDGSVKKKGASAKSKIKNHYFRRLSL